jgi:hypothetical protein
MNFVCISAHRQRRAATSLFAAMVLSTLLFAPSSHGQAAKAEEPKETIRQVIATPMLAAEKLLAEKKFQAALDQINEAEKVDGKTPYELYNLDRMRAIAALGVGNDALAVKSLESAVASGRIPAAESINIVEGIARIHYRQKDYKQAAIWAARATKEPGARIEMRLLLGHSAYLSNDFATAKSEIAAVIAIGEKAGTPPTEDQLRLLGSASLKTDDAAGYVAVLEKLAVRYPNKDYWADLIYRVESKKGFAERLVLDVYRLKLITGVLAEKAGFLEMASLALQSGYPAEAQKVIDAGIAAGALVKDTRVDSEKKLRDSISKELAEENALAAKGTRPAPKSSLALLNNGFDSVLKGDATKGLDMMEAGLKSGDLRRPEDAKLRYGIALVLAGQKPKASETFKTVQGADGNADLAHLWDLYSQQNLQQK